MYPTRRAHVIFFGYARVHNAVSAWICPCASASCTIRNTSEAVAPGAKATRSKRYQLGQKRGPQNGTTGGKSKHIKTVPPVGSIKHMNTVPPVASSKTPKRYHRGQQRRRRWHRGQKQPDPNSTTGGKYEDLKTVPPGAKANTSKRCHRGAASNT